VSGFDADVNYAKVAKALSYLGMPGCLFVSTNTDSARALGGGRFIPGTAFVVTVSAQSSLRIYLFITFCLPVQVRCVISGFDREINYAKAAKAVSYLRTPGCLFVSTNTDAGLPCGGDCVLPGTGSYCLS